MPTIPDFRKAELVPAINPNVAPQLPGVVRGRSGARFFYVALLVLSLMPGKICFAASASSTTADATNAERIFLQAFDAWGKARLPELQAAENKLRANHGDFPLNGYVTAWRMQLGMAKTDDYAVAEQAQIEKFLEANSGTPYADMLTKEWLRALGRRDATAIFEARAPKLNIDDAEIACHAWRFRLQRGDAEAVGEARTFWKAARATPAPCYDLYTTLAADGKIANDETWVRVRKLLDANLVADARRSAALISNVPAWFEPQSARVIIDSFGYLQREKLDAKSHASTELFLYALVRAARSDAERAADLLIKRGSTLSADDGAYAWAQVGLAAAMQQRPEALEWFARAKKASADAVLNETQAGWKIRAALRAAEWGTVQETIEALPAAEKREANWRYWLARAYAANGRAAAALPLREALAKEGHFYGVLAAEELSVEPKINWQASKPAPADIDFVRNLPSARRALVLCRLELRPDCVREWNLAMANLSDAQLLAAAAIAQEAELPDRAISAAERTVTVHDFNLRYPTPYREQMGIYARSRQINEAWLYGLIRQESRFMTGAHSNVGALGLMQLMPATARWAAKQTGVHNYSLARASEVDLNLELGSFYLRHVLDDLKHPVLATAAYNAGPGRARRWQADQALEGAVYAESIPFNETRDYVKKVMVNAWYYSQRVGTDGTKPAAAHPITLKSLLSTIPARNSGELLAQTPLAGIR